MSSVYRDDRSALLCLQSISRGDAGKAWALAAVGDWMKAGAPHSRYLADTLLKTGEELGWEWEVKTTVAPGDYTLMGPEPCWEKVADSAPIPAVILWGKPPLPPRP